MPINQALLPEWDAEMANTRKTLERVPDDKFDWKPHEKSPAMGSLSNHLANLPSWIVYTLAAGSLDLDAVGSEPRKIAASASGLLEIFDNNAANARAALAAATDEAMMQPWTLTKGGRTLFTLPKAAVIRTFVVNHIIHHRAQLGLYLRLNDVLVPAIYGPSADEPAM